MIVAELKPSHSGEKVSLTPVDKIIGKNTEIDGELFLSGQGRWFLLHNHYTHIGTRPNESFPYLYSWVLSDNQPITFKDKTKIIVEDKKETFIFPEVFFLDTGFFLLNFQADIEHPKSTIGFWEGAQGFVFETLYKAALSRWPELTGKYNNKEHEYGQCIINTTNSAFSTVIPYSKYSNANKLGDCGYMATCLGNNTWVSYQPERYKGVIREQSIWYHLFIEQIFCNYSYLLITLPQSHKISFERHCLAAILYKICLANKKEWIPIRNPRQNDNMLEDWIKEVKNDTPARDRYMCVMKPHWLLNYYNSEFYTDLNKL